MTRVGEQVPEKLGVRSYTLKSTLIMTTIDFTFMTILCYVLGLLLGVLPEAAEEYWKLAGLCYLVKTGIWFGLRIPLLLPIDRWVKRGRPVDDNDPALIRSIYYFPYDFSVFYGFLVFGFYAALLSLLNSNTGRIQISENLLLPGLLFAFSVGAGAVAIGVPVNLLLTAKFSRRLSERHAESFAEIPGKEISLKRKMATVAIALGIAPSLLLFSFQYFMQYNNLYQEAERTAETLALHIRDRSSEELNRWALSHAYPFVVLDGKPVFVKNEPPPEAVTLTIQEKGPVTGSLELRERRSGHLVRYSPGTTKSRGVIVRIPEPRNHYLAMSLIIFLASLWPLVTSLLIVETIVKPVSVIASFFHRITGRGRTEGTDRVPISYKDEVGRLAFNANRTIGVLTEARRQLEKNTQALANKNTELEEAYRTKGEFLANMSHELRTPLNAIIGFSRLMKRKLKGTLPERQEKNLELIRQSGEQLLVLVNDLLDFEKIEAGKMTIRREEFELQEQVTILLETMTPEAEAKGLHLECVTEDLPELIWSDKERFRQILTNLVTNAIKYSDQGVVTLKLRGDEERLFVEVSDQGIGMTAQQMERIFDPFHQVDGSETRERGGVGLGLAIVGRLVSLLKGKIRVDSVKGEGSKFSIELPVVAEKTNLLPFGGGAQVMVVDDNLDYLEAMHSELTEAGFQVTVADSGARALKLLEKQVPTAILLDVVMPEMDGWEVLRQIQSQERLGATQIVMTSVVKEKPVGLELEIAGWLTKPFDADSFMALVGKSESAPLSGGVLLVEDDEHTAQMVCQTLEEAGLTVQVVGRESEACALLDQELPSALILDLNLEEGSGWNVLAHLRKQTNHHSTRVFIYTASDLEPEQKERLNSGLVTLVQKHGSDSLGRLLENLAVRTSVETDDERL